MLTDLETPQPSSQLAGFMQHNDIIFIHMTRPVTLVKSNGEHGELTEPFSLGVLVGSVMRQVADDVVDAEMDLPKGEVISHYELRKNQGLTIHMDSGLHIAYDGVTKIPTPPTT